MEKEVVELRAKLGVTAGEKKRSLISAEIINYDPVSLNYSLIINRGARDGVSDGDSVIMAGQIIFFQVYRPFHHFLF